MAILDFDNSFTWGPQLGAALEGVVSQAVVKKLTAAAPEYVEDAYRMLLESTDCTKVMEGGTAWIRSSTVAAYHGTRLTNAELSSICRRGLVPLEATARRERLERALSQHPDWNGVANRLDSTLQKYGDGGEAGERQGQVHLTVSRSGLVDGFNHYLTYGSEFDQTIAQDLLGTSGKDCLRGDGLARVICLAIPGDVALDAANRFKSVDEELAKGQAANLVHEFLSAWSYELTHPGYNCATQKWIAA